MRRFTLILFAKSGAIRWAGQLARMRDDKFIQAVLSFFGKGAES